MIVDRPVKIRPLALNFNVGLIHPPRSRRGALPAISLVRDGTCVLFDPPIEGRVTNGDAALGHDLFEISVRNTKPDVEIHRVQDHGFRLMRAFETDQRLNPDTGFGKQPH